MADDDADVVLDVLTHVTAAVRGDSPHKVIPLFMGDACTFWRLVLERTLGLVGDGGYVAVEQGAMLAAKSVSEFKLAKLQKARTILVDGPADRVKVNPAMLNIGLTGSASMIWFTSGIPSLTSEAREVVERIVVFPPMKSARFEALDLATLDRMGVELVEYIRQLSSFVEKGEHCRMRSDRVTAETTTFVTMTKRMVKDVDKVTKALMLGLLRPCKVGEIPCTRLSIQTALAKGGDSNPIAHLTAHNFVDRTGGPSFRGAAGSTRTTVRAYFKDGVYWTMTKPPSTASSSGSARSEASTPRA